MRLITSLALMAAIAVPGWKAYTLNTSLNGLREDPQSVPFFAYYRYGFMTDSVVFNVNTESCATVIADVIPSFEQFVDEMQALDPREIRLAWRGETVAVVQRSAAETIWHQTTWADPYAFEALSRAIDCSSDDELIIDWMSLAGPPSAVT